MTGLVEALQQSGVWQNFDRISTQFGPAVAIAKVMQEAEKHISAMVEARVSQATKPMQPFVEQQEMTSKAGALFEEASQQHTADNRPLFPELRDATTAAEVVNVWRRLDLPPEWRMSHHGIRYAVVMYRQMKAMMPQAPAPSPVPAPPPPAPGPQPAAPETVSPNAAPTTRATGTNRRPDETETAYKRRIREAGGVHPIAKIRR